MKRRGSVLMEFIIVAPLMLILISMILQFAQIWIAREITAYAAYCACRSVLSAGSKEDAELGAQRAAELACSWMCLAGMPEAIRATSLGSSETVSDIPKFHDRDDIDTTETIYKDNGAPVAGEIVIPGWGSIPGSDSRHARVIVEDADVTVGPPYARVTVHFKFPMLLPLAGRMLSLFVNSDGTSDMGVAGKIDYGSHSLTGGNNPAWNGETYVMGKDGAKEVTPSSIDWGSDGKFPFIELTETAVLPMPYSSELLTEDSYDDLMPTVGGGL